jgi:DUF4097 and DUF4098 domain-containing protein YvlB
MEKKMKTTKLLALVYIFLGTTILLAANLSVEEKKEIQRNINLTGSASEKILLVDIINGSIKIKGNSKNQVEIKASESIRAKSKEKMKQAKEEVTLDIFEEDNKIVIYMEGPFRNKNREGSINYQGWSYYGYEVSYDVEINVPFEIELCLKTINDGDILVENCGGEFDIENINGSIILSGMSGFGRAYALNGKMQADFTKNPKEDCYFGSLNGDVEVYFLNNFAADIRLKTFNGEVYTDFEVIHLPNLVVEQTMKKGGKKVYKTNRTMGVRVGKGGPEIELDAFNGDILLRDRKNLD